MRPMETIFKVTEAAEGGHDARAAGHGIHSRGSIGMSSRRWSRMRYCANLTMAVRPEQSGFISLQSVLSVRRSATIRPAGKLGMEPWHEEGNHRSRRFRVGIGPRNGDWARHVLQYQHCKARYPDLRARCPAYRADLRTRCPAYRADLRTRYPAFRADLRARGGSDGTSRTDDPGRDRSRRGSRARGRAGAAGRRVDPRQDGSGRRSGRVLAVTRTPPRVPWRHPTAASAPPPSM